MQLKVTRPSRFKLFVLRWLLKNQGIYDICCALRGPDEYDLEIKQATTAVVRAKLLIPQFSRLALSPVDEFAVVRRHLPGSHFASHQQRAFEILGLRWSVDNGRIGRGNNGD